MGYVGMLKRFQRVGDTGSPQCLADLNVSVLVDPAPHRSPTDNDPAPPNLQVPTCLVLGQDGP